MNYRELALELAKSRSILRARDFRSAGVPLVYLKRLTASGDLVQLGRGLYQDPDRVGEHVAHDLAEAARLMPNGVVCLISALRQHELTTQLPHTVWMMISHKARTPKDPPFPLKVVRASGSAFTSGIETASIEGVDVPIYGVAKTVADCFKYRCLVGEDVAIEALRDALRYRKATPSEIMRYAAIDRCAARVEPLVRAFQE
ncbi:transcriptional regulator [Agrobacterium tumefaciens]|uniref:type IV toxin-antitoxin system AbiEi family antitoxin domain-containing protein n=1 Tax=Agrobacterium tumefaciens TaxID=358 RepID=UPI0012B89DCF|nr:type IV toxin-antitoxin system AbiEi family antitoxin domain-containing protein [Agrobacterium tumefaciens]MQB04536.1 transcriptional regulator [Agrobacterium tumefaciens]